MECRSESTESLTSRLNIRCNEVPSAIGASGNSTKKNMSNEHDTSKLYHSQRSADDDNEHESEVQNRRAAECYTGDANELGASHGEILANDEVDHDDSDDDDENYHADDDNDLVTQSRSLTEDTIVPDKRIKDVKLATKDTTFSLTDITGLDKEVKPQTIVTTAGNNGKEKPLGAGAKPLLTSNEYTAKVPTTIYPSSLGPKSSSPGLPRVNGAELNYFYNSRIPSLDATGINQNFLARHTTDQSLKHASQPGDFKLPRKLTSRTDWPVWSLPPPAMTETNDLRHRWPQSSASQTGDFNLPKKSTPRAEWPMWSLPPPDASETGHRWRHSSGLHPSIVGSQTGGQSSWQFWYKPSREMNSSNFNPQGQKSFNHIDPLFASGAEAFTGLRISDSLPATNGTISGTLFNTHAAMASASEPKWRYSANNSYGSHVNSSTYDALPVRDGPPVSRLPTVKSHAPVVCPSVTTSVTVLQPTASITSQSVPSYSYQSTVLPENGQERFMEPSMPNSFTENQEHVRPISSSALRREDRRSGTDASSPEFPDDPSLAALERKVAEACAVVERVMKEREERTKAQREAARKKREMREQREKEAREMREREERERREREEREIREREEREKKERKRREPIESDERETKWFGGERAPVQESPRWQCEHYQRRCSVKFPCCGIFYPCHRCHNTSGVCDTDDRKANNATHVKCGICGHEEEINEGSHYCSGCGEQMSAYFCFICKNFTGVEKNPFHCDKCGICSTHSDKSFHCDVCNVCLDKRLEGKHKCRPNSGHDECCVCLGDAFSGCQILPCSHKVHKECAIAMIQNGVRNCPICRHPLFSQA